MRILGIDPGIATLGLGVIDVASREDLRVVEWLTITTAAGTSLSDRLREIHTDLSEFLTDCEPDLAVVERLFFATNVRTALDVAHGRGVILLALSDAGIPVLEPSPLQLKAAITGDGKADKRQMQDMVMRMLKLAEIPRPDDAADALAMALYGALVARELIMKN
ncbi:crossover junction endodeoxyribonuclease RuvC [Candidatus Peregrinibacteria bacterium]|nr:crossover junction endodeoxyribonuclease RuvC [Candidatus Peregrinibacteria bacterium]